MFLRRLKVVTKKTSFLRCIWGVLKTSQKSRLFWNVSERSLRCLSQWRSDWDLSETSHAGWVTFSWKKTIGKLFICNSVTFFFTRCSVDVRLIKNNENALSVFSLFYENKTQRKFYYFRYFYSCARVQAERCSSVYS